MMQHVVREVTQAVATVIPFCMVLYGMMDVVRIWYHCESEVVYGAINLCIKRVWICGGEEAVKWWFNKIKYT
ncbi:unnamed protein product [Lathyrus oleraceus]